jgi:ligand-binding sensor domain-containing protein
MFFFPKKGYAETNWLKYFRKDALLNKYMRTYAVHGDNLWVGTYGDGLVIYDGKKTKNFNNKTTRTSPSRDDGLVSDYITCITIDEKAGRVWLGTNAGVSSCDLDCKNWKRFSSKNGLPNDVIRDLAIGPKGNLWVGTPSGVTKFDGENWKTYDETNGLKQNSVHSIKVKSDSIWVGTVGGTVSRFKNDTWKTFITY